jgi:hypothetical protein
MEANGGYDDAFEIKANATAASLEGLLCDSSNSCSEEANHLLKPNCPSQLQSLTPS